MREVIRVLIKEFDSNQHIFNFNKCPTTKILKRQRQVLPIASPHLLVPSRREVTACSRDIPARLLNTPPPNPESTDPPRPPSSALTSSPTRNMKILPPPLPPSRSPSSPRLSTKLPTSMRTIS